MIKKTINTFLLICGISFSSFLLFQAVPTFPNLVTKADLILKFLVILEAILLIILPIFSYFTRLRIFTIFLAIILIAMSTFCWFHVFSIINIIYSILIIGFNIYFK